METVRRERARCRGRAHRRAAALLVPVWFELVCPGMSRAAPHHAVAAHMSPVRSAAPAGAGGWSATACGREPSPPGVETATIAHYNASIDAVTAYDQAARAYNSCVSRTATAEQTAISAQAKQRIDAIQSVSEAVQRRIAANFAMLSAALKKGPPAH